MYVESLISTASALTKNDPFVLGYSDPHEEQGLGPVFTIEGGTINIIRAEGA